MLTQWFVVLRDLISLGQIGIKIIFAREHRFFSKLAVERQARHGRELDRTLVHYRQRTRHAETDRAGVLIVGATEVGGVAGKHFTFGQQLGVVEAMKMELALLAPYDGVVAHVGASAGDQVPIKHLLFTVEPA